MASQGGDGGQGGPWGSRGTPPDIEALIRQWQARLKQFLPSGGPSGLIIVAVLAVAGLLAWTAYYTVPSDSDAVVQRFGKYPLVPPSAKEQNLPANEQMDSRPLTMRIGKQAWPRERA